jgi:hypothetical protein
MAARRLGQGRPFTDVERLNLLLDERRGEIVEERLAGTKPGWLPQNDSGERPVS